ncbi:Pentatricopeptide repeat-containing protein [Thalictrum thalictroides]|uniref:Pentatricopeptide repeat-containing protein n=1 Tax=Thalictrum thalictroides TaxID=46969 RepID=A0A7J6W059_THATH|nr:Pentatricopeptide repeat-containing protein [Thalictrum thalictroides]
MTTSSSSFGKTISVGGTVVVGVKFCTAISKSIPANEPALIKLKNERNPDKLFHLFKANAENKLVVENRFAFEDTVSRLAAARRFDYIDQLLEQQKSLPQGRREGFIVRIITLYGNAGMTKHAVDTFYNMHLFGCSQTVKSFNAALKVLTQTRDLQLIRSFLNEAPQKFCISRDIYSVNIVIKAFCEMGFLDSAYLVMIQMEEEGIIPDVVTHTTLISAFYKNNRCEIGNGLWNLMILKGCYPNLVTFNVRIQHLVNKRKAFLANKLMGRMSHIGIKPDELTFNLVIKGFFLIGNAQMAKRIYSAFQAQHYKPNSMIYQTMIHYLCEGREFDLAYTFCKDSMHKNWFPNVDTVCMLLEGLLRNPKGKKAKVIMTLIQGRVPPYSVEEVRTFIHYLCKGKGFDLAYAFCIDSMTKNWFPSADAICMLLKELPINPKGKKAKVLMTLIRGRLPPYSAKELKMFDNILSSKPKMASG